jgi:hypothetical protein
MVIFTTNDAFVSRQIFLCPAPRTLGGFFALGGGWFWKILRAVAGGADGGPADGWRAENSLQIRASRTRIWLYILRVCAFNLKEDFSKLKQLRQYLKQQGDQSHNLETTVHSS